MLLHNEVKIYYIMLLLHNVLLQGSYFLTFSQGNSGFAYDNQCFLQLNILTTCYHLSSDGVTYSLSQNQHNNMQTFKEGFMCRM